MTPVERLEAAIAKLEQLKAKSTPGDWYPTGFPDASVWAGTGLSDDLLVVRDARFLGDAALIVTLHRTIDAQIDLLRAGLEVISEVEADPNAVYSDGRRMSGGRILKMSPEGRALMDLADAILGDNS